MPQIKLKGLKINFTDSGEGKASVVFLHYWGGSSKTWQAVIEQLAGDCRCIAVDLRGWGDSDKSADDYSLFAQADDVCALIESLGLKEYTLVGHSMGGKIAQIIAARRPFSLKQLILIAPAPPTPMQVPPEQRAMMLESYMTREGAEGALSILAKRELTAKLRAQVIEDTLKGAPEAKLAWTNDGMLADISNIAESITVPVTVIVGSCDPVEREEVLRREFGKLLPQSRFVRLEEVGHLLPLEAPVELAGLIRAQL